MSNHLQLYKPYNKQKQVHTACDDKETFFITVNAGRQVGKTLLSINQSLKWAIERPNSNVYCVSPSSTQCIKIYKQMLGYILEIPILKSYKGTFGDAEIVLVNNSTIKFRSALSGDTLRGESVHYMILDECADIKKSTIEEVLLPMLNVTGKKVLAVGTPKGKNYFHSLYMKGNGDDPKYKSFKFISSENPYSKPHILEMALKSLPEDLYAQEYLGEFVDSAAVFKNVNELATITMIDKPVPGDNYWAGVDIALIEDYTVIVLFNQKGELVFYDRFNNTTAPQLKERIIKTINLFKPEKIMIEANNQGLPIIDDLKYTHKVKNITGFNTTSKSKPEIINHLINAFGTSKLKIPNVEQFKDEIKIFAMSISKSGTVQYSAPSGFHDDCVMATAIGWHCYNKYKYNNTVAFT